MTKHGLTPILTPISKRLILILIVIFGIAACTFAWHEKQARMLEATLQEIDKLIQNNDARADSFPVPLVLYPGLYLANNIWPGIHADDVWKDSVLILNDVIFFALGCGLFFLAMKLTKRKAPLGTTPDP